MFYQTKCDDLGKLNINLSHLSKIFKKLTKTYVKSAIENFKFFFIWLKCQFRTF